MYATPVTVRGAAGAAGPEGVGTAAAGALAAVDASLLVEGVAGFAFEVGVVLEEGGFGSAGVGAWDWRRMATGGFAGFKGASTGFAGVCGMGCIAGAGRAGSAAIKRAKISRGTGGCGLTRSRVDCTEKKSRPPCRRTMRASTPRRDAVASLRGERCSWKCAKAVAGDMIGQTANAFCGQRVADSRASSRHSRRTAFAQAWHLPQHVPTSSSERNSTIVESPSSTARRIFRSETLLQTQTIIECLRNVPTKPSGNS
jgi:hypothetical protein